MSLIICFFLLVCIILVTNTWKTSDVFSFLVGIILFFIAAFRDGSYIDSRGVQLADYEVYISYFNSYNDVIVEPTFVLISWIIHQVNGSVIFLFIIYALIGVAIKMIAIRRMADFVMLSILVYMSRFFILHEMTQIRAGVAAGLILLSYRYIYRKNIVKFLLFIILASLFHISSLIILPFYFLNCKSINRQVYALLIPLGYLFYFTGISIVQIFQLLPIPIIQYKIETYINLQEMGDAVASDINVFNAVHIVQIIIAYLLLWKIDTIAHYTKYAYLFMKIYILALFFYVFCASFPVIAGRGRELMLTV